MEAEVRSWIKSHNGYLSYMGLWYIEWDMIDGTTYSLFADSRLECYFQARIAYETMERDYLARHHCKKVLKEKVESGPSVTCNQQWTGKVVYPDEETASRCSSDELVNSKLSDLKPLIDDIHKARESLLLLDNIENSLCLSHEDGYKLKLREKKALILEALLGESDSKGENE